MRVGRIMCWSMTSGGLEGREDVDKATELEQAGCCIKHETGKLEIIPGGVKSENSAQVKS